MAKRYLAKVEIFEIDDSNGTGRDKDTRTIHAEVADFTVRATDLDALKDKLTQHIGLI